MSFKTWVHYKKTYAIGSEKFASWKIHIAMHQPSFIFFSLVNILGKFLFYSWRLYFTQQLNAIGAGSDSPIIEKYLNKPLNTYIHFFQCVISNGPSKTY